MSRRRHISDLSDPFTPRPAPLAKLGSIAVHVDEALGKGGQGLTVSDKYKTVHSLKPLTAERLEEYHRYGWKFVTVVNMHQEGFQYVFKKTKKGKKKDYYDKAPGI